MDSPEVAALKVKRDRFLADRSDWGRQMAQRYAGKIRYQRLSEARDHGTHTPEQWLDLQERFDFRCVRCGRRLPGALFKDHITPIYQGGSDGIDNLQPLCGPCNTGKGAENTNWADYREMHGFEGVKD
jgi:5-methylcytosine-specific restriction endonuclease McrA